jgi:hypothetical protein
VYRQLLNSTAIDELREEVVAIIWSWVDDMDLFFHGAVTAPAPHGGGSGMLLLDSVCGMLHFIKTQSAVDRIRWRLLLYFLALLVDERISHVGDEDEVVDLLVQYGWISEGLEELLKAHLRDWLKAGRNYVELAQALGGAGALICLPLWGPSAWEHHCHPGGEYWLAIIGRLRELGVPTAAQRKRHQDYTAYDVAGAVVDHCFARCPTGFLSGHRSPSQRLPAGRRIRKRRRSGPPRRRRQTRRRAQTPPMTTGGPMSLWPLDDLPSDGLSTTHLSLSADRGDDCHVLPTPLADGPSPLPVA